VQVPLDAATAERLNNLADMCHTAPTSVAASLLHDVLAEDDAHHEPAERISVN
jgi:hypothetical protein